MSLIYCEVEWLDHSQGNNYDTEVDTDQYSYVFETTQKLQWKVFVNWWYVEVHKWQEAYVYLTGGSRTDNILMLSESVTVSECDNYKLELSGSVTVTV